MPDLRSQRSGQKSDCWCQKHQNRRDVFRKNVQNKPYFSKKSRSIWCFSTTKKTGIKAFGQSRSLFASVRPCSTPHVIFFIFWKLIITTGVLGVGSWGFGVWVLSFYGARRTTKRSAATSFYKVSPILGCEIPPNAALKAENISSSHI